MKMFAMKRVPHQDIRVMNGRELAEKYMRMQEKFGRVYRKVVGFVVRERCKGTFLEIGCGPGYQTILVAQKHPEAKICVLEPSYAMLQIVKANAEKYGLSHRMQFIQDYVENEALINSLGPFDLVYSSFSLHHWTDPMKAFGNITSVLKPAGIALLYDVERRWIPAHLPFVGKGTKESIRASYTREEIAAMLRGLGSITWQIERHFPGLLIRFQRRL
ncbi:MAG: class I SAM-dependent methyltransferase [Kiritimatiellia bacterium]